MGTFFLMLTIHQNYKNTYLVSNQTISEYEIKYHTLFKKQIQPLLNISSPARFVESFNYDMVWAIALAVNNSLSELKKQKPLH